MLIHWAWLIPAIIFGGILTVAIMCCFIIAADADERHERLMAKLEKKETAI